MMNLVAEDEMKEAARGFLAHLIEFFKGRGHTTPEAQKLASNVTGIPVAGVRRFLGRDPRFKLRAHHLANLVRAYKDHGGCKGMIMRFLRWVFRRPKIKALAYQPVASLHLNQRQKVEI